MKRTNGLDLVCRVYAIHWSDSLDDLIPPTEEHSSKVPIAAYDVDFVICAVALCPSSQTHSYLKDDELLSSEAKIISLVTRDENLTFTFTHEDSADWYLDHRSTNEYTVNLSSPILEKEREVILQPIIRSFLKSSTTPFKLDLNGNEIYPEEKMIVKFISDRSSLKDSFKSACVSTSDWFDYHSSDDGDCIIFPKKYISRVLDDHPSHIGVISSNVLCKSINRKTLRQNFNIDAILTSFFQDDCQKYLVEAFDHSMCAFCYRDSHLT